LTSVPSRYGCRNCNLTFVVGVNHGPGTHPKRYVYGVCDACGWMYRSNFRSYSLFHPLQGLYFDHPNYLITNPKRAEIDVIKSAIHDETIMEDVAEIMKRLPIRKEWKSSFAYRYKKVQKTLTGDIPQMTVVELRIACEAYKHKDIQLYSEYQLRELPNVGNYWNNYDKYSDLSRKEQSKLKPPTSKFRKLGDKQVIYSQHSESTTFSPIHTGFENIQCINCKSVNRIRSRSLGACPRCQSTELVKLQFIYV